MDTPAVVARSAAEFASWVKAWYQAGNVSLKSYTKFPQKLIYPIDTPGINTTAYPSPCFSRQVALPLKRSMMSSQ